MPKNRGGGDLSSSLIIIHFKSIIGNIFNHIFSIMLLAAALDSLDKLDGMARLGHNIGHQIGIGGGHHLGENHWHGADQRNWHTVPNARVQPRCLAWKTAENICVPDARMTILGNQLCARLIGANELITK